jgi:hypothetical protein
MPTWFVGKIRYQQPIDEMAIGGRNEELIKQKVVTEAYLIDAVSYTDAEARLYKTVADSTPDFEVTALAPMKLADVLHVEGGDNWYRCKVVYMTEDEKSGKEKKVVHAVLINGETVKQAYERTEQQYSTLLVPFTITDVVLTPILEVVPYDETGDSRPEPLMDIRPEPVGLDA